MADASAPQLAWTRTKQRLNDFRLGAILLPLFVAVLGGVFVAPPGSGSTTRAEVAVVALLVASVLVVGGTYIASLWLAPYEQRDAARADSTRLQQELTRERAPKPAPSLRLDYQLDADVGQRCFRLRAYNDSATATRPCAELVRITDESGADLVDVSQLPIELEWTHHPEGPPSLTSQLAGGQTFAVLGIDQPANAAEAVLFVYGRKYRPGVGRINDQLKGRKVYMTVSIRPPEPEYSAVAPYTYRYLLKPDPAVALRYRP